MKIRKVLTENNLGCSLTVCSVLSCLYLNSVTVIQINNWCVSVTGDRSRNWLLLYGCIEPSLLLTNCQSWNNIKNSYWFNMISLKATPGRISSCITERCSEQWHSPKLVLQNRFHANVIDGSSCEYLSVQSLTSFQSPGGFQVAKSKIILWWLKGSSLLPTKVIFVWKQHRVGG